jgi:phospholipid-binding lipoprotein MlaA
MRLGLIGRHLRAFACLVGIFCAGFSLSARAEPLFNAQDPFEVFNRGVFAFNEIVDHAVLRPVALVYTEVVPRWLRNGVNHFFGNLADAWAIPNNALALRGKATSDSFKRVAINSTVGMLGLIDVATELDIDRHPADLGLTLSRWGLPAGPYVVVPLLGPRTMVEVVVYPIDWKGNLANHLDSVDIRDFLTVLSFTDLRASYLQADDVVKAGALDPYSFTRDSYLQRRQYLQNDGENQEDPGVQP